MTIARTKFESGPANTMASRFITFCSEKAPARSCWRQLFLRILSKHFDIAAKRYHR